MIKPPPPQENLDHEDGAWIYGGAGRRASGAIRRASITGCRENYVTAMGDIRAGRLADDRRTKFAGYLDRRPLVTHPHHRKDSPR
jgi:hypothetical protein